MDTILEFITTRAGHLIDRLGGPLNFRLVVMPLVVSVLAARAGYRDARQNKPAYVPAIFRNAGGRLELLRSAAIDVGKIFIVALVLDSIYQVMVLREFYVSQLLFVAMVSAIVPYLVVRSLAALLLRRVLADRQAPSGHPSKQRQPGRPD
jgi:hypothetical protein